MARYTPDLMERWVFVPTIAAQAAPTVAEIGAGTEITGVLTAVTGFSYTGTKVETPDLGTRFNTSVAGRFTAEDSTIEFYKGDDADDVERDVEDLLPDGTAGYIVRFPPVEGAKPAVAAALKCAVWPVTVMANSENAPAPAEPAKFTVSFSIPRAPTKVATVAA
jgi:hypothetical protein